MAKQLNVNLAFSADTNAAKKQLQDLQQQLSKLIASPAQTDFPLTEEILKASNAAAQLQTQLQAATNVDTGKLDLNKFSQQLTSSGMSLEKYQQALSALGPTGDKAFAELAQSISGADAKLLHANTVLGEFVTSLKNTARWQLSSSILHGFMGTLSSAYNYAQDLNKSLNNIRIVTGQSTDQMAAFAEKANKAAQNLNSTTTAYTNAALIFYQQGLDDEKVKERTDAVIKMSNITGDSAEDVSSYMTAIWENFDDGSKSLEYYADVITRLGADTAASSAEIAEGLESFASIGNTIGLSYEYATSALTTIVAKTRASASEVGNGLRTIFSRLQNLSLGETLEDGTDLTKYTKALATVGVDIKDASGELKSMDNILDDLAGKWKNLDQAEKVALANTVGGVRQYTKLIALMDNWGFMKENISRANNSEGSLQEQADIYAESWGAAQKRVKASAQAIYQALLDDEFFIKLTNLFANLLKGIDKVIDGLGGLKGVLLLIGSIATQTFGKEISNSISSVIAGIMSLTKAGKQKIEGLRSKANDMLINNAVNDGTTAGGAIADTYKEQGQLQNTLIENASHLTDAEKKQAQLLIDINKQLGEEARNRAEALKAAEQEVAAQKRLINLSIGDKNKKEDVNNVIATQKQKISQTSHRNYIDDSLNTQRDFGNFGSSENISRMQAQIKILQEGIKKLGTTSAEYLGGEAGAAFDELAENIDNVAQHYNENGNVIQGHEEQLSNAINKLSTSFKDWDDIVKKTINTEQSHKEAVDEVANAMAKNGQVTEAMKKKAEALVTAMEEAANAENRQADASGRVAQQGKKAEESIKKMAESPKGMTTAITQASSAIMAFGSTISSVCSLIDIFKDKDADTGEVLLALVTTIGTLIPVVTSMSSAFSKAEVSMAAFGVKSSIAMWQVTVAIAAITALVAVIIALNKAIYNSSPEGIWKSATKATNEAKEAAEQVKQSYDDLQNSLKNLDSGIEKIESLTRGTLEWRQAIAESNNNLIELLSSYKMLNSENFTVDADGIMRLTDKAREKMNNDAISAMEQATNAQYGAQVFANNASSRNEASKVASQMTVLRSDGETEYDVLSNNSQISADVGMAIAQALNNGSLIDINDTSQIEKALNSVSGLMDFEKTSIAQQIAASDNLRGQMEELAATVAANTAANDVLNQQIIDSTYGDKISQSGLEKSQQAAATQMMGDQLEKLTQELYDQEYKDKGPLGGGKTDEEIQKAYAEAMGWATDTIENKNGNKAKYYAKDGAEIGVISDEVARKYLAQQAALEKLGGDIQGYIENVKTIANQGDQIADGVGNALLSFVGGSGGSFDNLTKSQLAALQGSINANVDEEGKLIGDTFQIGDITVDTEYAKNLGYESVQAYYDAISNALTNGNNFSLDEYIMSSMSKSAQVAIGPLKENLEKMTIANQKEIVSAVQEAFNANGSAGANALVKQINAALEAGADENDISILNKILTSTDWDTASLADFKDALLNAGLDTKKLGIDVETIFEAMSTGASTDLANVQKTYKSIHDIIKDLATGDTISDKEYNKLSSQIGTEAMDGFFSTMADGTHQLVGDAKKFYNIVTENSRQVMLNNISNANNLSGSLENTSATRMNSGDIATQETSAAAAAYLQTLGLEGEELNELAEIQNAYNQTGTYTIENMAKLDELMANHQITEEEFKNLVEQNNDALKANSESLLSTATSLEDFYDLLGQITDETDGSIFYSNIASGLINLASKYDNCSKEITTYQKALRAGNAEQIKVAETALQCSIRAGELGEEFNLSADSIEQYAKEMKESGKYSQANDAELIELAKDQLRYDRAVKSAIDNLEDWKKALKEATKSGHLNAESAQEIAEAYGDMLDIDGSDLSNSFLKSAKNLKLMEDAMNGNEEAYQELQSLARQDLAVQFGIDDTQFQQGFDNILQEYIHVSSLDDIEVGADLNDEDFLAELTNMVNAAGLTADQATDYLSSMGVDAEVVEDHSQMQQNSTYMGAKATVTHETGTASLPLFGAPLHWDIPSVRYEPQEVPTTATVEGGGFSLKVKSAKKSSGGNIKHTNSNAGTPASSKKGSGGGGSSSQKTQTHNSEKPKNISDEKDRYHVIKNQIEDLTAQYDKVSKAKDKAFGPQKLANLNKEIEAQKKLTQVNKKYLDEVKQYLELDRSTMAGRYGAQFDENGTITNYDEMLQKQVDAYNQAVKEFNNAYTDDEGAKAAFEAAQERYEEFKKALDKYEESQDLLKDQEQAYIDAVNAERALLLEKTQLEVELKVNVEEDSLAYLEYALDNIENKAYDCAEAFSYLNQETTAYLKTAKAYESGLRSLFANQGLTDEDFDNLLNGNTATFTKISDMLSDGESAGFTSDDIQQIRDYIKEIISANQNLQEVRKTVHDQVLTVWDEWNEKLDNNISKLEHLQNITESYKNIIDIIGQRNLGVSNAFMQRLEQQTVDQANDKLQAEKARYDALKKSRDEAYAKFEEQKNKGILSEEEIKMWEDNLQKMDSDVQSASEDFQSAWEDALTAANEAFEASVDRIIKAYDDAAAGLMGSMSDLQDAFDRKSDLSSQYLADYEKIYQFSKLNRDIENSIDTTDNVKAKKELLELQSKINAYEEAGTEISEYQMNQLRQEYELKKAQIELEEAKDSKSQVKMQRDSEGNYSYVYTANSDDVAKAEQNYEDKLHDMQQSNAEYINDLQSNMIQMEQDYQDKIQEIMTDTSLTAEERMVKLNELNEYYDEKLKFYISEAELWEKNSQTLYERDWMNYAEATGYKISEQDRWLDHWNETQLAMLTGFGSLEEYQNNHNTNVANLLLASGEAFSTWQTSIETAMESAGTSIGDFETSAKEALDNVAEESDKTKDSIEDMSDKVVTAVKDVTDAVANWENAYSTTVKNMLNYNNNLITSFNALLAAWSGYAASVPSSSGNDNGNKGNNSNGNNSSSNSSNGNNSSSNGNGASTQSANNGSSKSSKSVKTSNGSGTDIRLMKQFGYDTGGYTGDWGVDGRIALLHQKELVLNADDTSNFLKTVDIVRQISDMIDLNALTSAGGLSSLFTAAPPSSTQNLQQEVHITAEFPNATDKDQISEAFSDLVNLASQYANRK